MIFLYKIKLDDFLKYTHNRYHSSFCTRKVHIDELNNILTKEYYYIGNTIVIKMISTMQYSFGVKNGYIIKQKVVPKYKLNQILCCGYDYELELIRNPETKIIVHNCFDKKWEKGNNGP